jgi:hypothetical protein
MSEHVKEGAIQAWLDNELRGDESARVESHIEGCVRCREIAQGLQRTAAGVTAALSQLDVKPSTSLDEARWEVRRKWARGRGRGSRKRSVAAAAVLVLVAGGAAALVPGSPLKELWSGSGTQVVSQEELAAEGETDRIGVAASYRDGRMEVGLENAPAGFQVEIRSGSGDRVQLRAHPDTRFDSSAGRVGVNLEHVGAEALLEILVPPGSGEVLLRTGSRYLVRWSEGRFELGEGIDADPLPDGVRLRVPEIDR